MRDRTPLILLVVAILLGTLLVTQQGLDGLVNGLLAGGRTVSKAGLILVAAFVVAGLTQVLVTEEFVTRWLGVSAGWKGIALACLAGALIPGGPYVYYPITAVLLHNGASLGVLVAFIAAKNLWSVSRLPYEMALIGMEFTLIRFAITFVFPPLLGYLADRLFGGYLAKIRKGAPSP